MGKEKITILYSNIRLSSLPLVVWYLLSGGQIRYFRMHEVPQKIFRFINTSPGRLSKIHDEKDDFFDRIGLQNVVLDSVERGSSGFRESNIILSRLIGLFNSPELILAFNKADATELHSAIHRRWSVEKIVSRLSGLNDYLWVPDISDTIIQQYPGAMENAGIQASELSEPFWLPFAQYAYFCADRIRSFVYIFLFPFWIICRVGLPSGKEPEIKKYETAIRVYKEDLGFHYTHRSIDFLLDEDLIKRENTLFCIDDEIGEIYENELAAKGYNYIYMNRMLHHAGREGASVVKKILPAWNSMLLGFWRHPWHFTRLALELLNKYITWDLFFRRFSLRHYVAYNDTTPAQVGRNILFSLRGVQSWYYVHSVHSYDVFTPQNRRMFREIEFSFMNFSHIVGWGNNVERYYRACPNANKKYDTIGCLWSQHVTELNYVEQSFRADDQNTPPCLRRAISPPNTIIGIFDTSFGGGAPLDEHDMILFIGDMIALAADFPNARFIYKNKYLMQTISQNRPDLKPFFEKIRSHPSFYFCDEATRDPADVIAVSDLTISLVFTSPTIEALGARKRAVYYDPGGRFRHTYYDKFPNLIAHDYEGLKRLVRHWIESTNDAEFDAYLDDYVRGELDAYVDGKAISRFRELLVEGFSVDERDGHKLPINRD